MLRVGTRDNLYSYNSLVALQLVSVFRVVNHRNPATQYKQLKFLESSILWNNGEIIMQTLSQLIHQESLANRYLNYFQLDRITQGSKQRR